MSLGELIAAMMIVWRVLVPIQIVSLNIARLKQTLATVRQINDLIRMGNEHAQRGAADTVSTPHRAASCVSGTYLSLGQQARAATARRQPQGQGWGDRRHLRTERKRQIHAAESDPRALSPILGTIRLGGLDLRQLHPAEARAAIGYASQQPAFFYGSIAANFRFACPDATDADIIDALAAVGVTLPHPGPAHGLATRISGTDARSLSQGWLCRLSIARALVKKPAILLLDDLGNGLDPAGDAAFMAHLEVLSGKSTVLLVTARPSHMRMADRVIEMRGGTIVTDGKPEVVVTKILARSIPRPRHESTSRTAFRKQD